MTLNLITIQASEHPIKSVTISKSSKAEVVRTFALDLKKGQNKVEIKGLPSGIDTARPSGLGNARLDHFLYTVERTKPRSTSGVVDVASTPDSISLETIRLLSVKLASLEKERFVQEQQAQLLLQYANSLKGEHVTPSDLTQFLDTYVTRTNKSIYAVTEINERIVALKRQIEDEQIKAASKTGEANGKAMALINSDADASIIFTLTYIVSKCEWKPKYELHTTTQNGKPSSAISLHYLATISQSTGEDWTDAVLTLSTTTTNLIPKGAPTSAKLKIRVNPPKVFSNFKAPVNNSTVSFSSFTGPGLVRTGGLFGPAAPQQSQQQQGVSTFAFGGSGSFGSQPAQSQPQAAHLFGAAAPQQQQQQSQQQQGVSTFPPGGSGLFGSQPAQSQPQPTATPQSQLSSEPYDLVSDFQNLGVASTDAYIPAPPGEQKAEEGPAQEPASVVQETPLSMYFSVTGKPSIPSDGLKHRVTLAVLPFDSKISYVTIPRDDPTVFLQCEVKNTSEYRLITGPMDVIVDGSYITATLIRNDINVGESFECILGDDISTKVTYVRSCKIIKPEASAFAEATIVATYTTKITIKNKHTYDITDLVVRDRMPTSDDQRVRVILRQPIELGDATQGQFVSLKKDGLKVGWEKVHDGRGGEKEGKFEWRWRVKSGETVELLAEYDVKGPKDVGWDIVQDRPLFGQSQ